MQQQKAAAEGLFFKIKCSILICLDFPQSECGWMFRSISERETNKPDGIIWVIKFEPVQGLRILISKISK